MKVKEGGGKINCQLIQSNRGGERTTTATDTTFHPSSCLQSTLITRRGKSTINTQIYK